MFLAIAVALPLLAADLPVRHVVLYKNGVGYFERSGPVKPGEAVQLSFEHGDMNDILKSLTVRDASGAAVRAIRYESSEPLETRLAQLPFAKEKYSLSAFLNAHSGARITLTIGDGATTGRIVLARMTKADEREQIVLLLDSAQMRTLDLAAATGIEFADPTLQKQLREHLQLLVTSRTAGKRTVTIDSSATSLTASYMVPSPVWKSSYRLIFDDAATLEGWAIVDNTSGEDWKDVRLALVSGRPVSFISNLFEARMVARQAVELPESTAAAPIVHDSGVAGGVPGGVIGGIIGAAPMAAPPPPPPPAYMAERAQVRRSTMSVALGRDFGDLFEYSFPNTVTIPAGQSAMLPFLQQKIAARKLLIYSDRSQLHPYSAAELTNSTGKTLDGGPITVFDSSSYSGEALMSTLKHGDKRLVSFAVDLGTRIATSLDSGSQEVREVRLQGGVLTTRRAHETVTVYTIRNVDARAKTLWIEHAIRPQHALKGVKPVESTATAHRFEVKLTPQSEQQFRVVEEFEIDNSFTISDALPSLLLSHIAGRGISEAGRKALKAIVALRQKLDAARDEERRLDARIQENTRDQERIRQNIMSLNSVSSQQPLVDKYARQLADLDTNLAAQRDEHQAAASRRAALEGELRSLIDSAEF